MVFGTQLLTSRVSEPSEEGAMVSRVRFKGFADCTQQFRAPMEGHLISDLIKSFEWEPTRDLRESPAFWMSNVSVWGWHTEIPEAAGPSDLRLNVPGLECLGLGTSGSFQNQEHLITTGPT